MRVLLTGASGQLGVYATDVLLEQGHQVVAWSGRTGGGRSGVTFEPVDLTNGALVETELARADPAAILHLAAISSAEGVRQDLAFARLVNVEATRRLAEWCGDRGRGFVFTSTDLVFDGSNSWRREADRAEPILAYGRTKREAELAVLAIPTALVARVSLLYGPSRCGRESYFDKTLAGLRQGVPQSMFEDEFRTPLDLLSAARALVGLLELGETGVVHVGGRERVSRYDLIRRAAIALRVAPMLVRPNRRSDTPSVEPRPADVSLDTTRLAKLLPDLVRPSIEEVVIF